LSLFPSRRGCTTATNVRCCSNATEGHLLETLNDGAKFIGLIRLWCRGAALLGVMVSA